MRTEDDIRAAFRVLAASAPDPESVLAGVAQAEARRGDHSALQAVTPPTRPARSLPGRRAWTRRLAPPIAAAVAVLAIIGLAVALAAGGTRRLSPGPAQGAGSPAGLPRYYVAYQVGAQRAVIGDLATGAMITVNLPRLYVDGAAVTAGDRAFVFQTSRQSEPYHRYYYLARLSAPKRTVSLSRLPITATGQLVSFGLSPAGTALAVAFMDVSPPTRRVPGRVLSGVNIYSLNGTLLRAWRTRGYVCDPGPMTWAQNGLLMIGVRFQQDHYGECVLNVSAPGSSLLGAIRLVVPRLGPGWVVQTASMAGNGQTIAATANSAAPGDKWEFVVFSAVTGTVLRRSWPDDSGFDEEVLWDSYSGSQQIVQAPVSVRAKHQVYRYGVLTSGEFVPFRHFESEWFLTEFAF